MDNRIVDTDNLHQFSSQAGQHQPVTEADYVRMAIAGVLRHAQEGELPLFAWTLGMQQDQFITMLHQCFPELQMAGGQALATLSPSQYQVLLQTAPADFLPLTQLLLDFKSAQVDRLQADWLARAIAAASFGSRHLWQDLGLPGREVVSKLMQTYFTELDARNIHNWKWKRFLFAELGLRLGKPDLRPPKCTHCGDFHVCFPD